MNTKKIIGITAIAVVVLFSVVMLTRQPVTVSVDTQGIVEAIKSLGGSQSLGGITNYDEIGSNNVAKGFVRLNSTSTSLTADVSHRLGWANNTGKTVYVPISSVNVIFTPTAEGISTSSPYRVFMASSTSKTSQTPLSEYEYPSSQVPLLIRGMLFGSSTRATTTNALFYALNASTSVYGTGIPAGPAGDARIALASTSANVVGNLVVAPGEAIQVVIQDANGRRSCSDSNFNSGNGSVGGVYSGSGCTSATSTDRNFTLQVFFDYFMHDPDQPAP